MIYSTLSETFTYDTFRCSIDILKDEENYTTEYIKSFYYSDILDDKDIPKLYGVTKYFSKDETPKLLGIEYHNGIYSEFNFTKYGFNKYKQIVLDYIKEKIETSEQSYDFVNDEQYEY